MSGSSDSVVLVSVVRDHDLYHRLFDSNPVLSGDAGVRLVTLDNAVENKPIPVRYNEFLDGYDYANPAWFVFCHEDVEFKESLSNRLANVSRDALYGPVGCVGRGLRFFRRQHIVGSISVCKRDGTDIRGMGKKAPPFSEVSTFDCCCLIVHSSLVLRCGLRFDERLLFDLYVEDFCALGRLSHGVRSRLLPIRLTHHSESAATDRLFRHLPYLRRKYPRNTFFSTCCVFGRGERFHRFLGKLRTGLLLCWR